MRERTIASFATQYKGVMFRSTTEARWAVFLDLLGVQWQYEPLTFSLPSGQYTPDFALPEMKIFVEIKPSFPVPSEICKAEELAVHTNASVYVMEPVGFWSTWTGDRSIHYDEQVLQLGERGRLAGGLRCDGVDDRWYWQIPDRCSVCGQFVFRSADNKYLRHSYKCTKCEATSALMSISDASFAAREFKDWDRKRSKYKGK